MLLNQAHQELEVDQRAVSTEPALLVKSLCCVSCILHVLFFLKTVDFDLIILGMCTHVYEKLFCYLDEHPQAVKAYLEQRPNVLIQLGLRYLSAHKSMACALL